MPTRVRASANTAAAAAPPGDKRSRARKRSDEAIDAAAAVFAQHGYRGATTQDIADRLRIRQASLYYYFASKEDALEAVCERGVEGFVEDASAAARAPGSACERLARVIGSHLHAIERKHDYVHVFIKERQHLPNAARRRVGRLSARYEATIEGIFEAGVAGGELRADLDCRLATLALLALCNSAAAWYGRDPRLDAATIASAFSALLCHGVAAAPGFPGRGEQARLTQRKPRRLMSSIAS